MERFKCVMVHLVKFAIGKQSSIFEYFYLYKNVLTSIYRLSVTGSFTT